MKLYAITISGVYPNQVETVTDSKARANKLKGFIVNRIKHLSECVDVIEVDSFYPKGYCEADTSILRVVDEFNAARRG